MGSAELTRQLAEGALAKLSRHWGQAAWGFRRPQADFNQHFLFGGISLYISIYSEFALSHRRSSLPTI